MRMRKILRLMTSQTTFECDGTRAETRFRPLVKRTSPFKSAGASVLSTIGSRGLSISGSNGSNAGYTMFRGSCVRYCLPTPFASFPFTSPSVRHRVPSRFKWTLPLPIMEALAQRTRSRSLLEALFSLCVIIQYKIRVSINTNVILF